MIESDSHQLTDCLDWTALVLGGGDANDTFAAAHGVSVKPLIPLAGQPLAWHVLRALRKSGRIKHISYIGPTTLAMDKLIDQRLVASLSLLDTLEKGLRALPECQRVLVCSADIPLLQGSELASLLSQVPAEASLVYPIIRKEVCESSYSGSQRTYAQLQEGIFTGGNIFLADPAAILQVLPQLRQLLAARKNPLKLASLIGPDILLRFIIKRLSLSQLEARISKLLGARAQALVSEFASVGSDIDKESDLTLAQEHLAC